MARKTLKIRPLTADDLRRVIDIDAAYVGRRREGFYRKRLEAAVADPRGFAYLGYDMRGKLKGFLLARFQEGEYGTAGRSASLDAIGVDPLSAGKGIGRGLLAALDEILRHKGIAVVYSQAEWRNLPMLRFFAANEFSLAPRYILERDAASPDEFEIADELAEATGSHGDPNDYSDASPDRRGALARDLVQCRAMQKSDVRSIVRIDREISGRDNSDYYEHKMKEVFDESGIRVSLVAIQDDHVVGFAMARVDFGEFDRIEPVAVLDSIAVDPGYMHHFVGTAMLSQLFANLSALRIEIVRSEADAQHLDVMHFLQRNGFSNSERLAFVRDVG